jgi:hypothetical protein
MKKLKITLLCLISTVSLVACLKTPILSITPGSAALKAGAGSATFTATLTDGSEAITWAINPDIGSLSSATGTSTTYTPPATVPGATVVAVTASSKGAASVTATITINSSSASATTGIWDTATWDGTATWDQ